MMVQIYEAEENEKKEETCEVQIFSSETKLGFHHQFCGLKSTIQQILPNAEGSEATYS
jgi:hypothetical protein